MAKKATEINEGMYIDQLVSAGIEKSEATETVGRLVAKVNELMEGESMDEKMNVISIKLRELIASTKSEKYKITVVAKSGRYDGNAGIKKHHLKVYESDPDAAKEQGIIRIINGVPTPIDNRKFLDKAGTKENKFGYNKPYKVSMKRDIIGIFNGEIVMISGDIDVIPGNTYEIFGKVSGANSTLYAATEPAPRLLGSNGAGELYDMVNNAAKESSIAMDVDGALETEEKGMIIVKGYVHAATPMSNGKHKIVINNEMGRGFIGFPSDEVVDKAIQGTVIGSEVIAIGRMKDAKDPQYGRSMTVLGIVMNPKSGSVGKTLETLKEFNF